MTDYEHSWVGANEADMFRSNRDELLRARLDQMIDMS
jgi:hypothetical protein